MKKYSAIPLFLGVLLCAIALTGVYHFATTKQAGKAVIATISGITGGIIVGTITTTSRLRSPRQ